jgi:hypothetical protein
MVPVTYIAAHPETPRFGPELGAYIEDWPVLLAAACGGWMVVYGLYHVFGLLTGKLKPGDF